MLQVWHNAFLPLRFEPLHRAKGAGALDERRPELLPRQVRAQNPAICVKRAAGAGTQDRRSITDRLVVGGAINREIAKPGVVDGATVNWAAADGIVRLQPTPWARIRAGRSISAYLRNRPDEALPVGASQNDSKAKAQDQ